MKFKLYTEYGSLNSRPVFESLKQGLQLLGHDIVDKNEDIAVIWSVLWNGRMMSNKQIYEQARKEKRPILIAEVGNLIRNHTWRLSLNHVNALGYFGNDDDLSLNRPLKLGLTLKPIKEKRKNHILIACQHQKSLQWEGLPDTESWLIDIIDNLKKYTDRPIVVRPHPRSKINFTRLKNIKIENPIKLHNTYDDFDINYDCHVLLNHNSGPSIQALINGVPIVCDRTSLAFPLSTMIENIDDATVNDRTDWFIRLCHTEWTVDEVKTGEPLKRILKNIEI